MDYTTHTQLTGFADALPPMAEKLIFTVPPVRVDEPMFRALSQQAMSEDRPVSYVVRVALRLYLESHGRMVGEQPEADK